MHECDFIHQFAEGLIGFEMSSYTAQEESGLAEVCVSVREPADPTNISPLAIVFIYVESMDGSATGETAECY